ncbi:MAG TPA: peptide-methionine (S)-S-oxide reductase MsrA [Candidatus Babeliales bacterium]|nr:peptide-methionine (S)-S-oxide reductase MsrA [Candidatus Babeliales bacterium]
MSKRETAIFGAGCFWGVQYYFDQVPGVIETEVGYIGGRTDNPSYWDVASKKTGHAEAIKITFDPSKVNYHTLLKHFFRMHDPTQLNRDGPNIGPEYRSAIFYADAGQKKAAEEMINMYNKYRTDAQVVTTVEKAETFWPAEEEHQNFTKKTGIGACHIDYAPIN